MALVERADWDDDDEPRACSKIREEISSRLASPLEDDDDDEEEEEEVTERMLPMMESTTLLVLLDGTRGARRRGADTARPSSSTVNDSGVEVWAGVGAGMA